MSISPYKRTLLDQAGALLGIIPPGLFIVVSPLGAGFVETQSTIWDVDIWLATIVAASILVYIGKRWATMMAIVVLIGSSIIETRSGYPGVFPMFVGPILYLIARCFSLFQ